MKTVADTGRWKRNGRAGWPQQRTPSDLSRGAIDGREDPMNARISIRTHLTEYGVIDGPTADRLNDVVTLLARWVRRLPKCQDTMVILRYSEGVLQSVVVKVPESVIEEYRDDIAHLAFLDAKDQLGADSAVNVGRDHGDQ
jgi:hypothetical protein